MESMGKKPRRHRSFTRSSWDLLATYEIGFGMKRPPQRHAEVVQRIALAVPEVVSARAPAPARPHDHRHRSCQEHPQGGSSHRPSSGGQQARSGPGGPSDSGGQLRGDRADLILRF
jgi:hypothetical protein